MNLDPRTPVVVGVGQFTERIDDPATAACRRSNWRPRRRAPHSHDCGADVAAVAAAIDTVAGVRQFEISGPAQARRWASPNNYPRSVANRIGADPARAMLEPVGGQGPQQLITEFAGAIAAGDVEVAMIFGSEPRRPRGTSPSATTSRTSPRHVDGQLEDRGYGLEQLIERVHRRRTG